MAFQHKFARRSRVNRILMSVDEIDRVLRILHCLSREAKKEKCVIPNAGLRAFFQNAAHRLALRALDHVFDHALGCRLKSQEQHPAAAV